MAPTWRRQRQQVSTTSDAANANYDRTAIRVRACDADVHAIGVHGIAPWRKTRVNRGASAIRIDERKASYCREQDVGLPAVFLSRLQSARRLPPASAGGSLKWLIYLSRLQPDFSSGLQTSASRIGAPPASLGHSVETRIEKPG